MKPATAGMLQMLNNSVAIKAIPELIVEWNQNRYSTPLLVRNFALGVGLEEARGKTFPISSIVEVNRPASGIIKGMTGASSVNKTVAKTNGLFKEGPAKGRYYTVSETSRYKYWLTPTKSNVAINATFGDYEFPAAALAQPFVTYTADLWTNKIVLGFENTWTKPTRSIVYVTYDGTTWVQVATNPSVDANGRAVLYLQANSTWAATVHRLNAVKIRGVRVDLVAIDKSSSYLGVIEISPRLENDLTDFVVNYSSSFTLDDPNYVSPLGKASSNTASVELSNVDGRFNNDNSTSIYFGLIEKNALFTLNLVYENTVDNNLTPVRQFTMYADNWGADGGEQVSVDLKDYSKFLQEEKTPKRLVEKVTAGEAIWQLCDSVGFVDYQYTPNVTAPSASISFFWTDGEETVWESLSKIAESTQTAIFFDEFGIMKILTREVAFSKTNPVVWDYDATGVNGKSPDIIEANVTRTYEGNSVSVKYKTATLSSYGTGFPVMETVWEPGEDFVLRVAALSVDAMTASSLKCRIPVDQVKTWPYQGMLRVEGELMRYKGKSYTYFTGETTTVTVVVNSKEEQDAADKLSLDTKRYKNGYNGNLEITERGAYGTAKVAHSVTGRSLAVSSTQIYKVNLVNRGNDAYIRRNPDRSTITFGRGSMRGPLDWHSASAFPATGTVPNHYGTSIKFTTAGWQRTAGMYILGGANDAGYYLQIAASDMLAQNPGAAKVFHEICLVVRRNNGTLYRAAPLIVDGSGANITGNSKGIPYNIAVEVFYDFDLVWEDRGPLGHKVTLFVNGKLSGVFIVSDAEVFSRDYGLWIDGDAQIECSYLYAFQSSRVVNLADDSSVFERIKGGSTSIVWNSLINDYSFNLPASTNNAYSPTGGQLYDYHEFGALVHEVRELKIDFDKFPVVHSRLYVSNDSQIVCPQYRSDPFSASFILENRSRKVAIGNGTDETTFGPENSIEQKMMIYGRVVTLGEEQSVEVKDLESIRAQGKVEVSIESAWIQSKAEAERLAAWIVAHWSKGADEVELSVFGNPLVQVGDVVTVNYPQKNLLKATHKYFVVAVSNSFNEGLETSLTLRRALV